MTEATLQRPWIVAVDRGGTFTDLVLTAADGSVVTAKVPSPRGRDTADAALAEIRRIVGVPADAEIPADAVRAVRCGTTAATNALLERRGEPFALFVTRGFADLLEIGTQDRPDLFALNIVKTVPLAARVIEVDERVLADGTVRTALDEAALAQAAAEVAAAGLHSAAVLFLHSYAYPEHELRAGAVLAGAGIEHVTLSHQAAREIKAVARGETASADAYLTPVLRRALRRFRAAFAPDVDVRFIQSHGALADAAHASGPRGVLSGPAGGALACAEIARRTGESAVIGFDMGGTSTDVSRYAGELDLTYETRVAGHRLQVPSLRIVTVAAGGGSVLHSDGRRLLVGPESGGADPGPAGYGCGGPATITDANAVLGRLLPQRYPQCFGPDGDAGFDALASRAALALLADSAGLSVGAGMSVEAAALGFAAVANERMAQAIREVSVARGFDLREHALIVFGGAGGQHACAVARALGTPRVIVPRLGSVLSAWGVLHAGAGHEVARALLTAADADGFARAHGLAAELRREVLAVLAEQGVADAAVTAAIVVELRHAGQDATLPIDLATRDTTLAAFHAAHRRLYGFARPDDAVEIVNVRVRATAPSADVPPSPAHAVTADDAAVETTAWFDIDDEPRGVPTPVRVWASLAVGEPVAGPALVVDALTTVVVHPGFVARLNDVGDLLMEDWAGAAPAAAHARDRAARDPVTTALFANRFMSIAERMGSVLERVSHSTNIKERLDFSCAVFDGNGQLVANAPHIPVHLGAMGESVRAVLAARGDDLRDGDVVLTNDPFHGGSHLPDVTAVTPVLGRDGAPAFFVANRAHHADIGGISPGSMPPLSTHIDEEGVRIHGLLAVRGGELDESAVRAALSTGRYPARGMTERLSDLRAQAAANAEGAALLRDLVAEHGEDVVGRQMAHVLDDGEHAFRELIAGLAEGELRFADELDDGTPLVVTARRVGERLVVDFSGTGPRSAGNLNAPKAVARAAVLFALRTLLPPARDVPLNEGCMRAIELVIPDGCLLAPEYPDAVVGGNVETSMRLVDLVLGALGALAAGQGTMNNLTFGPDVVSGPEAGDASSYYETIAGGAGAGPTWDGASAVHTHMTNTRITDPEVLETRWPVVLRRFGVRRGSGGAGRHRGGDGVVREIEFLVPMRGGILSERRRTRPFGLAGGEAGASGHNVRTRGGAETDLPGRVGLDLEAGDVLRIETPGGGGFGGPGACPRNPLA